jgi:hypothetical protein
MAAKANQIKSKPAPKRTLKSALKHPKVGGARNAPRKGGVIKKVKFSSGVGKKGAPKKKKSGRSKKSKPSIAKLVNMFKLE